MKTNQTATYQSYRQKAILHAGILLTAAALMAPATALGNCGPSVDHQVRTHLGAETMGRGGSLTQTITMTNTGGPLKGSVYLGISNLPSGVDATPVPSNSTLAFTSGCDLGVKYFRIYLGAKNEWATNEAKTLQVGFPFATQPFTYSYKVIKGTMPNFSVFPGDYDGDHAADLAVFNKSIAQWTIKFSTSNLTSSTIFGAPNDKFVVGDFDGDLKEDLATYQPATHKWSIRRSSDGVVQTVVFGTPNAIPVPADYDGDGYTDIAIYDPPTHQYMVIQSTNQQVVVQALGQVGDVPVPADYDGDGKADFAVYRAVMKTFVMIYSHNNQPFSFGAGDFSGFPFGVNLTGTQADPATYDPNTGMLTIHVIATNQVYSRWVGANAVPVVADFGGDLVPDFATFSPSTAGWAIDSQMTNLALHPILSLTFGTPNADIPVMAVPSSQF